jgi:hypothetical protein
LAEQIEVTNVGGEEALSAHPSLCSFDRLGVCLRLTSPIRAARAINAMLRLQVADIDAARIEARERLQAVPLFLARRIISEKWHLTYRDAYPSVHLCSWAMPSERAVASK